MELSLTGHTLPVNVSLWAFPPPELLSMDKKGEKESLKIKTIEHHPSLFWIAAATKSNDIEIWDLGRKEKILSASLAQIFDRRLRQAADLARRPALEKAAEDEAKLLSKLGDIQSLKFIDKSVLAWNCGCRLGPATRSVGANTFLIVHCDNGVFRYDLFTEQSRLVTNEDLKRSQPTAIELISPNLLAIGCSDGNIRVWDMYNWVLVHTLQIHTREICVLKSLGGKIDSDSGPSETETGAPPTHKPSNSSDGTLEGRMRLFSLSTDGAGMLWESRIVANVIDDTVPSGRLAAPLSSSILSVQYDSSTDTLVTICADRRIRLWDLSSKLHQATATRVRVRKGGPQAQDIPTIPLVGLVVSSPSLGKYVHCASLAHPRYPRGSVCVCFKTDVITIATASERAGGDATSSDNKSTVAFDGARQRLVPVQEISLSTFLLSFLEKREENFNAADVARLRELLQDHALKVYEVHPHPLRPSVCAFATNMGVCVLTIDNTHTHTVAAHPAWGAGVLMTFEENNVTYAEIVIDPAHQRCDTVVPAHSETVGVFTTTGTGFAPSVVSGSSGNTKKALRETETSRPKMYPSPTGKYLALIWPDSDYYLVLDVSVLTRGGERGEKKNAVQYKQVDSGNCLSFGWAGPNDRYTLIQPGMFLPSGSGSPQKGRRRWGSVAAAAAAKQTQQKYAPPLLVVKFITPEGDVITTGAPGGPEHSIGVHGGLLLCITHAVVSERKGQLAVSKVEREQFFDEKEKESKEKERLEVKEIRSQFFKCNYSGSSEEFSATAISLVQAGPAMPRVTAVEWDFVTGLCAVIINTRVNILSIEPTFRTLASLELCTPTEGPPSSLCWSNGVLFATTQASLVCVFTEYPYEAKTPSQAYNLMDYHGSRADVLVLSNHSTLSTSDPVRLASPVTSSSFGAGDSGLSPMMPPGFQQSVCVLGNKLVLGSWDGTLTLFPLLCSPLCCMGMLLAHRKVEQALEWCRRTHPSCHDQLALMLARRSLVDAALSLPGVSWHMAVEICMRFELDEKLAQIVRRFPQPPVHTMPIPAALGTLPRLAEDAVPGISARHVCVQLGWYLRTRQRDETLKQLTTHCVACVERGAKLSTEAIILAMMTADAELLSRAYAAAGLLAQAAAAASVHGFGSQKLQAQAQAYQEQWKATLGSSTRFPGYSVSFSPMLSLS